MDIYYDTSDFALSKNNIWLRYSEGKWELKIPKYKSGGGEQKYQEIEGEERIRQIFDVIRENSFEQDILKFGYVPFLKCEKNKKKKSDFSIELEMVLENLKKKNPEHYAVLLAAKIF